MRLQVDRGGRVRGQRRRPASFHAARAAGVLAAVLAAAVAAAVAASPADGATAVTPPAAAAVGGAEIRAAVEEVRKDPNLGGTTHVRTLRWVDQSPSAPTSGPPRWIVSLFAFFARAGGLLLWGMGAVVVAIAVIWIYRVARANAPPVAAEPVAVSEVQNLDIRPASLPEDVGAAALALLAAGRVRESLSLLYRGALSRAVHQRGVAIGTSFTEGEVLAAVDRVLEEPATRYFNELVGVWRLAVYAGEVVDPARVEPLCERFGVVFAAASR